MATPSASPRMALTSRSRPCRRRLARYHPYGEPVRGGWVADAHYGVTLGDDVSTGAKESVNAVAWYGGYMRRVGLVVLALVAAGCPAAPTTVELEPSPRTVKVGPVMCSVKLPKGIEHHQSTKATTRYMIPGRGGTLVHLGVTTGQSQLTLDERAKRMENGVKVNGYPPIVVRKEVINGRGLITTKGAKGWSLRSYSWLPLPAGASPYKSLWCTASIGKSSPIVDPAKKRRILEEICESVTVIPEQ
jgi:hypothetical protein